MQKTGRDKGPENSRKERGSFTPDFQFPNSFSSVYFLPGDVREIFGLSLQCLIPFFYLSHFEGIFVSCNKMTLAGLKNFLGFRDILDFVLLLGEERKSAHFKKKKVEEGAIEWVKGT